jgi:hypothetical protein
LEELDKQDKEGKIGAAAEEKTVPATAVGHGGIVDIGHTQQEGAHKLDDLHLGDVFLQGVVRKRLRKKRESFQFETFHHGRCPRAEIA